MELKYRGWDVFYNKFVFSDDEPSAIRMSAFWQKVEGGLAAGREVPVNSFTGLKDKNQKDIYEDDIVLIPDEYTENILGYGGPGSGPTEPSNHLAKVAFGNGEFVFIITDSADILKKGTYTWNQLCDETGTDDLEIVGNIYENPELLE